MADYGLLDHEAFRRGFDHSTGVVNAAFDQRARQEAGVAFAKGDMNAATGALANHGMIDEAMRVQRHSQGQEDRDRENKLNTTKEFLNILDAVSNIPMQQRQEAFEHIAPDLQQMGVPPEVIEQMRRSPKDDQTLKVFRQALGGEVKKYQIVQRGLGGYDVVDPRTGDIKRSVEPMQQKAPTGYAWTADGSLVAIPGGPADPSVVGTTAERKAAASAKYRAPKSGGKGSARSGSHSLPSGFTVLP